MAEPDASPPPSLSAPGLPLFRPEALEEPEWGEAFAFAVPRWRQIGALGLLAASVLFLFSLFADFDRVARVPGIVVPASGVSRLVAQQAGTVTSVFVRQGGLVRRGDPLLKIASNRILPTGAAAPAEMLETFRRQQRIAREEINVERRRGEAERLKLEEQAARLTGAGRSFRTQIALQGERIAKNEQRLRNLAPLLAKGYVSDVTYQAQEEAVLSLRQQLATLQQNEEETRHELEQTRLQLAALGADAQRSELQSAAAVLELERGAAGAQAEAELTLAAPVAGTVTALRVSPGTVVAPNDELAAIVRSGDDMEVVLFVPPSAAGSLRRGQQVALRYDAFPYLRFGVGRGVVEEIASTVSSAEGGTDGSAYRVRVRLVDTPGKFALRPDMTLSASIVLEKRSLIDWLLAPLREKWRQRGDAA